MANVKDFGAKGDGKTNDTEALQHAVNEIDGVLELPRGDYRILQPIVVPLRRTGFAGIRGDQGTARILMEGRDSAGKGGGIKRITQRLNPRISTTNIATTQLSRVKQTVSRKTGIQKACSHAEVARMYDSSCSCNGKSWSASGRHEGSAPLITPQKPSNLALTSRASWNNSECSGPRRRISNVNRRPAD